MTVVTRLVRGFHAEPDPCPRCGASPVLMRFGLFAPPRSLHNERLWFECPECGRRGGKSASRIGAMKGWGSEGDV